MAATEKRTLTARLAGELAHEYEIHQRVLARVLKPFAELKAAPGSIHGAKAKVKEIVRRLDVIAVKWSEASIGQAYRSKRKEISALAKTAAVFTDGIMGADKTQLSVSRLAQQSSKDFLEVNTSIERTVEKFFRAYEEATRGVGAARMNSEVQAMTADMEMEVSRKVNYYLARGYDEGSISRKIRSYLEELVKGENFIEINGRFYELKALAENMARTELHKTYVEATVDECKKWECDLVQFSKHDSPCPLCAPLEGMVFSISGEDEDFPALDDTVEVEVELKSGTKTVQVDPRKPHENCEHGLNPVTRNILRAAGEL